MDEKNIALLGFISKAADYLKDQIDEDSEEIKEVGEVDLEKIKNELSKKMGSSFGGLKDKKDDLITAGREAFDDFISSNSLIDDFKDIFNVDFKEKNDEKDEHIINHLMEMLNEPQHEDTNEYEQIITKATSDLDKEEKEDTKELEIYKDDKQDEEIDSLFSEIVAHENGDKEVVEETTDDIFKEEPIEEEKQPIKEDVLTSSEFKKILEDVLGDALSKLSGNITPKEETNEPIVEEEIIEEPEIEEEPSQDEFAEIDVDEILDDIKSRENEIVNKEDEFKSQEETFDDLIDEEEEEKQTTSNNYQIGDDGVLRLTNKEGKEEPIRDIEIEEELPFDEIDEDTTPIEEEEEPKEFSDFIKEANLTAEQKAELMGVLDAFSDIEIDNEEPEENKEDTPFIENEVEDNIPNEEIVIEEVQEPKQEETLTKEDEEFLESNYVDDYNNRSLDDLYIANPGIDLIEEPEETIIEEESKEPETEEVSKEELIDESQIDSSEESDFVDEYISSLMDDLSKKSATDIVEEERQKEQEAKNKIYESIKSIYPYLSDAFIKGVYDLKDSLSSEYKDGEKIVILHRLVFADLEGLRRFVEVIMSHDYLVNVDEKQMIVDAFKEHINSDGKILTDIFEVANQAKLLTGEYDGYRIIKDEENSSLI